MGRLEDNLEMSKLLAALVIVAILVALLLFIDRPFVRLVVTPDTSNQQDTLHGPWVQIENQGIWDATPFGFGCSVVEAKDANGGVVIPRRTNGAFLMAEGGMLTAGERRGQSCAVQPEEIAGKAAQAEMRGLAFFGVRHLPLTRMREFRILLQRDAQNHLQITSIEPI
jgi:hypothetical protein